MHVYIIKNYSILIFKSLKFCFRSVAYVLTCRKKRKQNTIIRPSPKSTHVNQCFLLHLSRDKRGRKIKPPFIHMWRHLLLLHHHHHRLSSSSRSSSRSMIFTFTLLTSFRITYVWILRNWSCYYVHRFLLTLHSIPFRIIFHPFVLILPWNPRV